MSKVVSEQNTEVRMSIDLLVQYCGHFCDCETNNGYGCNHLRSENGECHRTGCPVASYDSDKDEMVVFDVNLMQQLKDEGF